MVPPMLCLEVEAANRDSLINRAKYIFIYPDTQSWWGVERTIYATLEASIKLYLSGITPLSTVNHHDQGPDHDQSPGREYSRARVALSKHPISTF